jgi:hypothetical protein
MRQPRPVILPLLELSSSPCQCVLMMMAALDDERRLLAETHVEFQGS